MSKFWGADQSAVGLTRVFKTHQKPTALFISIYLGTIDVLRLENSYFSHIARKMWACLLNEHPLMILCSRNINAPYLNVYLRFAFRSPFSLKSPRGFSLKVRSLFSLNLRPPRSEL